MNKLIKLLLLLLLLAGVLLAPAALGALIALMGTGQSCTPDASFVLTCIKGTYILLSTALGGIMWAGAAVVAIIIAIMKLFKK